MQPRRTLIGTKAIVFNRRGKILILRRSEKSTRPLGWDFPGGALEPGEDPEQGVLRELREEAGITADRAQLYTALQSGDFSKHVSMILAFIVKVPTSDVRLSTDHESYQWLTLKEALALPMPRLLHSFLEKLP